MSAIDDAAVKAAIIGALTPFAGQPLSPENIEKMTDAATDALLAFEKTRAEPSLDRAECRRCVEVGIDKMLKMVAREMASEATSPGGDA